MKYGFCIKNVGEMYKLSLGDEGNRLYGKKHTLMRRKLSVAGFGKFGIIKREADEDVWRIK